MKRIVIVPIIIILVSLISACTNEEDRDVANKVGEINKKALSEEAYSVVEGIGADVSVFPINWTGTNHMVLHFYIDYYEDGNFTGTILELRDLNIQKENFKAKESTFYFSTNKIADEKKEEWTFSHRVDHSLLSKSILVNEHVEAGTTITTPKQNLVLGKDTILQVIVWNPKMLNPIYNSEKLFENDKAKLREVIDGNKYVYVLRVKPVLARAE